MVRRWVGGVGAVVVTGGLAVGVGPSILARAGTPAAAHRQARSPASPGQGSIPTRTVPPTTTTTAPPFPALPWPPRPALVATATVPEVALYPSPGAASPTTSLANPNNLGAPLVFLARAQHGTWLRVMVPMRPNGSEAWIRADQVKLSMDDMAVQVSLSAHRLTVLRDGQAVAAFPVAVGRPSAPTPTGHFYLAELLQPSNPNGPYGPLAYGTSDFSNVYTYFEGGPGQVGVHGTNEPWVIGHDASHGCVRLYDADIVKVAHLVPVGSPLTISP